MSSPLADAITAGFAAKYDEEKKNVGEIMRAEARKMNQDVTTAKLETGRRIRAELKDARAESTPDQDYIAFLVSLLNEAEKS